MSDKVMRCSEAFKLQVVDELARGLYGSPFAATRAYGIGSVGTARRWLVQYGKAELLKKVVRVEKRGETTELNVRQAVGSAASVCYVWWVCKKSVPCHSHSTRT